MHYLSAKLTDFVSRLFLIEITRQSEQKKCCFKSSDIALLSTLFLICYAVSYSYCSSRIQITGGVFVDEKQSSVDNRIVCGKRHLNLHRNVQDNQATT